MTLRSSDLQSDRDLDSIRNSCDVYVGPSIRYQALSGPDVRVRKIDARIQEEGITAQLTQGWFRSS